MFIIVVHNTSASSIECVVKTIALLPLHYDIISHNYLRFSGSKPVDGSSKNIINGSPTNAIAIDNLLFIPPDN